MSKPVEHISNVFQLSRPLLLANGETLTEVKVREPEVRDFRISSQQAKIPEEREVIVVARCCGLVLEDVDSMKWADYQKIQTFLFASDDADKGSAE